MRENFENEENGELAENNGKNCGKIHVKKCHENV